MPSRALTEWQVTQANRLDQLENAHTAVGGTGRGRRYATDQINHAYLLALAAQFQGFCRNLHSEGAAFVVAQINPAGLRPVVSAALTQGRKLDRGNAHSGSIGDDFARFDMPVWKDVYALHALNKGRRKRLDQLNTWRNAIAHEDFNFNAEQTKLLKGTGTALRNVRGWRGACDQLAVALDQAVREHLDALVGHSPW